MQKYYTSAADTVWLEPPRLAHRQFYDASDVDARIEELERRLAIADGRAVADMFGDQLQQRERE